MELDYIGYFQDGRVFDTSVESVANDNASYPKAVTFLPKSSYSPLFFKVGQIPAAVIKGFEEGVLGMKEGETRVIEIPPEKGYGAPDPTKIEFRPLVVELPQVETLTTAAFLERFKLNPGIGLVVKDPLWNWNATVTTLSQDFVTIMHLPEQGMTIRPYGAWEARVLQVDSSANAGLGRVVVRHLLDVSDVNTVKATDGGGTFRVIAVDVAAGTYTVDYNREVVGKTLYFWLNLLVIVRI